MKIAPLKKTKSPYDDLADSAQDSSDESEGMASWAATDPKKIQSVAAAASVGGGRAPEIFFKDGEERTIRLLTDDPIASFGRYRVKLNNRWSSFTKPPAGQPDAFAHKGLRDQQVYLWEAIDYNGYLDKQKKPHRNLYRYLVAGNRIYQQLSALRKRYGPLNKFDITVARVGSDTSTTYNLMPSPAGSIPEEARLAVKEQRKKMDLSQEWRKLYAPLKLAKQCAALGISEDELSDND